MKKIYIAALTLILVFTSMTALAEQAAAGTSATLSYSAVATLVNEWGILKGGATVYRDTGCSRKWATVPSDMIVKVHSYGAGIAVIKNGSKTAYVAVSDLEKLEPGKQLYANRNTRAYQVANLKSRYLKVPQGLTVEFVGISGSCAKVKRNGHVGYMYIGHLTPVGWAWAV